MWYFSISVTSIEVEIHFDGNLRRDRLAVEFCEAETPAVHGLDGFLVESAVTSGMTHVAAKRISGSARENYVS